MATELKAIDLLGSSPPVRPHKLHQLSTSNPDIPDEASREEDYASYSSSSEKESNRERRKKKIVTFAKEYSNEPKGIMDSQDSDDEDRPNEPPSPFLALRSKRSASLPHIELNPKLNKKIKKMMEGAEEEDSLNTLLEGTLTLFEEKEDKSTSELRYEYEYHGGQLLQVRIGDITEESSDTIVNEANSNLQHNSGISGLISQVGGRDIQIQSDRWIRKYGPVPPGRVAVTEAGSLRAKRVIHAVGPIWRGGNSNEDHEYWDAIWHAMEAAHKYKFKSISIPAICVGFLGFPKERSAYLIVDCVSKFFLKYPKSKLREVRLVNFDADVAEALVFEMVGKFTAGCETSESERDYSESEIESEASEQSDAEETDIPEVEVEEEEDDTEVIAAKTPEQKNVIANTLAQRKYLAMKAQSSRRQSIA